MPRHLLLLALLATTTIQAHAAPTDLLLPKLKHQTLLTPTVPDNGDQNPYAIVVAPVTAGTVTKDDVLVTNFNNDANLQGLGTTIIDYNPTTKAMTTFAKLPRTLPSCPGGIGFSTAMAMLKSGYVIVGSTPSTNGFTATKGAGCLLVLDATGKLVDTWTGPDINGPWGNMALIDTGATATLFVSNAGFGTDATTKTDPTTGDPTVANQATILRLTLNTQAGAKPTITTRTVIASGFPARGDKAVFLIGPTGLALAPNGTLYVSDAIGNRITAIDDAPSRTTTADTGRVITQGGLLNRPLALALAPNNHLLVMNGLNGQVVEIDPTTGKQLAAKWIDPNKAQSPPGSGDLFGIAMTPQGDGIYFVEDENNALMLAQ